MFRFFVWIFYGLIVADKFDVICCSQMLVMETSKHDKALKKEAICISYGICLKMMEYNSVFFNYFISEYYKKH